MSRSRATQLVAILGASLAMALLVVVSGSSHEADPDPDPEAKAVDAPGPEESKPVAMPVGQVALEIDLGLKKEQPRRWEGDIEVSEGRVAELEVVRAAPGSEIDGLHFAVGATKKAVAAKAKAKAKAIAKKKQGGVIGAILRATIDAPPTATVTMRTDQGEFRFVPGEIPVGRRRTFLDDQVAVVRQVPSVRMTGPGTEDDFPASARAADGSVWLVDVAYRPEHPRLLAKDAAKDFDILVPRNHGDRLRLRRFDGKAWQPPIDVTDGGLDVWRPTVAVDGKGVVWVAWAQQVGGDWEIFRRGYTPPAAGAGDEKDKDKDQGDAKGSWSEVLRTTESPGSDFHVVSATDSRGVVWLAWQSWRGDNYDIVVSSQQPGGDWGQPRPISESPANDWGPAIVADAKGGVFVAWDTYDRGNYDVRLRAVDRDDSKIRTVAGSARFEGRPHLACDKGGRVWIAYEEGDEQWGKDFAHEGSVTNVGQEKNPGFALYVHRKLRVKCLAGDTLYRPAGALEEAFRGQPDWKKSVPRLAVDGDGGVWLLYRHHPGPNVRPGEVWIGSAVRYDGKTWSTPRTLASSSNIIDVRPALEAVDGGVLAVYSGDSRSSTESRKQADLFAALLTADGAASQAPELVADGPGPEAELEPVHPDEPAAVARVRAYRVEAGGKSLRLLRGEFHRHTEFSSHNDQDGLLEDAWRYALDAGRLDWMGDGDHDNGFGHEYMWWLIQKVTDLHHNPPHFVPAQTYERSVNYPNGHRNVMMPVRGIRPLPRGALPGTPEAGSPDTKLLYAYLKHFGGICASHTSATNMGTDWRDNDPEVEPVVEIYQGHRHNYEAPGAPRSPTARTQIGGFEPAGFVWNALARGYRLGFQSSSDHVSSHISYAVVLTDEVSRRGILEAFKRRHSYAATDNIILDVRSGDHLMGDAFETAERPALKIVAEGTAPIAKVHVIRDNAYVFSGEPGRRQVALDYADDAAEPGQSHYYYVRIEQADGNLAWASPIWIAYKK